MNDLKAYLRALPPRVLAGGRNHWPWLVFAAIILVMIATGLIGDNAAEGLPWLIVAVLAGFALDFLLWQRKRSGNEDS